MRPCRARRTRTVSASPAEGLLGGSSGDSAASELGVVRFVALCDRYDAYSSVD